MNAAQLTGYVGGAAMIAPVIAALCLLVSLIWQGRTATRALIPASLATGFFLALALHPLPDPATFDCARKVLTPRLTPFSFVSSVISHTRRGIGWQVWFSDLTAISAVMNLLICGLIGFGLAAARCRTRAVALFALLLPLIVETTQITGFFGVYGCPYRQFDVDDIILNVSGVLGGFLIWRALIRK